MYNHNYTRHDDDDHDDDILDAVMNHRDGREGFSTLTRQMENEDQDQFDVDVTIMDFLAYKAINLIFEWRSSINPYMSDLPSALASMTAGTPHLKTKRDALRSTCFCPRLFSY